MKSCVRLGSLVFALGLAGLLAGCVSHPVRSGQRARDFEIVETSTKRQLTPKEMAQLQVMVADYLKKEGIKESGDYYVKVFLAPDKSGSSDEWVVVRYTQPSEYVATHFSVLTTYPNYGYASNYPRYSFDYYPFGWFGFSALTLSYFDDPYYYSGYGRWPHSYTGGRRWDRDHPRRPGGEGDHDRPGPGAPLTGGLKPSYKPTAGTGGNHVGGQPSTPSTGGRSGRPEGRPGWQGRNPGGNGFTTFPVTGTPYTPTYRPPTQTVAGGGTGNDRSTRVYRHPEGTGGTDATRSGTGTGGSGRRETGGRERGNYTPPVPSQPLKPSYTPPPPSQPLKPSYTPPRSESSRQVQSTPYTPPAPRNDPPAPVYTPPETRSDSGSSQTQRANTGDSRHEAGRRARLD